jgi:hypothetical protein
MTAGAVAREMGAHELLCWAHLLFIEPRLQAEAADTPVLLEVDDEIAVWG